MGARLGVRVAVVLGVGAFTALAGASCVVSYADCDYSVRRCRTVCDYWCDFFGCHPTCWDQCWYECYQYQPQPPSTPTQPPPPPPSSPPPSGSPPAAHTPTDAGGRGVLCSACKANDDCQAGALCVQPGGETGMLDPFCSTPCATSADCPAEFSCSAIGTTKQCLPLAERCR